MTEARKARGGMSLEQSRCLHHDVGICGTCDVPFCRSCHLKDPIQRLRIQKMREAPQAIGWTPEPWQWDLFWGEVYEIFGPMHAWEKHEDDCEHLRPRQTSSAIGFACFECGKIFHRRNRGRDAGRREEKRK